MSYSEIFTGFIRIRKEKYKCIDVYKEVVIQMNG